MSIKRPSLEEIIHASYCGIGEDTNPCLLAVKEWLTGIRNELEEKQDITEYQLLPVTYQWIESRKKFCDELIKSLHIQAKTDAVNRQ